MQRTVEEGDILVVDDVNVFSERSLEFLKKKTNIIIYKKQPAKELVKLGISFLNAVHIPMKETTNIAIIEQEAIERERKKIYSQRLCKSTRKSVNHLSRSPR